MKTFQDFTAAVEKGRLLQFVRDAIEEHRNSDAFKIAKTADDYDAQRNTTINETVKRIYNVKGVPVEDFTASNNRIASNFFALLNYQRCTYSLGNGVTFDTDGTKKKLGDKFDTDLFFCALDALKHGVAYGFWNVDRLHVFPLTQFVPLLDETDGTLRAGIRFWSLDWKQKPVFAVLYEEDGYTKYRIKGESGLTLEEMEPKRAYKQTIARTEAGGDEVIGEENYGSLPIIPLYGNRQHQSTLVGMRAAIDSYDLIQSGFANDLTDTAELFWLIGGAQAATDKELQQFMDRVRLHHIATFDDENSRITPYLQEPPFNAREAYLMRIERSIYRDFGAVNPEHIAAGNVTATQIMAAYQAQDQQADAFEYQLIEFIQALLELNGLEGTPQFNRNRIANQTEQIQAIVQMAQFLDHETILELFPNITPDMIPVIMERKAIEDQARWTAPEEASEQMEA